MPLPTINSADPAHFTKHAVTRAQQRGIKNAEAIFVFEHGDIEEPARSNCSRIYVSKREIKALINQGVLTPAKAERCQRIVLVTDGNVIITLYRN